MYSKILIFNVYSIFKNSSITLSEVIPILKKKIPKGFTISWGSFFLNQGTVSFNLENYQQAGFSRTSPTLQTTAGLLSRVTACILTKGSSWWGENATWHLESNTISHKLHNTMYQVQKPSIHPVRTTSICVEAQGLTQGHMVS